MHIGHRRFLRNLAIFAVAALASNHPQAQGVGAAADAEATRGRAPDSAQSQPKPPEDASSESGGRVSWRGFVGVEGRIFNRSPALPDQIHDGFAFLAQPEFGYESADRRSKVSATLFGRASVQPRFESADIRELNWQYRGEGWTFLAGMNRVFWGATESRHLIDIVNQSDLRENFAGDVKLGQMMVSASWQRPWGQVELYALPFFRERPFPQIDDRLRLLLPVTKSEAEFPDGKPLDAVARISVSRDDVDLHAYYFRGLSREPDLAPVFDQPGPPAALKPLYRQIDQLGADLQYVRGAWLFKGELMYRRKPDVQYAAGVGGFEYTIGRVFGTTSDLGLLGEFQFDNRPDTEPPAPAKRGIYAGFRWAFNDDTSSELKSGAVYDTSSGSWVVKTELTRRLSDKWGLYLEHYGFIHVGNSPALRDFARDSYLSIVLRRYL